MKRKAKNFLQTWKWLLTFHATHFKRRTSETIILGITTKINLVIGFVATIKCVVWMANPSAIPDTIKDVSNTSDWIRNSILIATPSSIFLIQAILQRLHEKRSSELQNQVAIMLTTIAYNKMRMETHTAAGKPSKLQHYSAALKTNYNNIVAIESRLMNLLSMSFVLLSVSLAGFFINWKVMSLLVASSAVMTLLFFFHQHRTSAHMRRKTEEGKSLESQAIQRINELLKENATQSNASDDTGMSAKTSVINFSVVKRIEKSFQTDLNFWINSGQAIMMVIFLIGVLHLAISDTPLSWIATLAIIFRFTLGYAQAIVRDASNLISSHQKLIRIKSASSPT